MGLLRRTREASWPYSHILGGGSLAERRVNLLFDIRYTLSKFAERVEDFSDLIEENVGYLVWRSWSDPCRGFVDSSTQEAQDASISSSVRMALLSFCHHLVVDETTLEGRSEDNIKDELLRLAKFTGLDKVLTEWRKSCDQWFRALLLLSKIILFGGCKLLREKNPLWFTQLTRTLEDSMRSSERMTTEEKWEMITDERYYIWPG